MAGLVRFKTTPSVPCCLLSATDSTKNAVAGCGLIALLWCSLYLAILFWLHA